jgi:hypothetical protein
MIKSARNKGGYVFIILLGIAIGIWPDYRMWFGVRPYPHLFPFLLLEAKKQTIVETISMTVADDVLIDEDYDPIQDITWCLWGIDSWTYKSSRTRSALVNAFDQSFANWWSKNTFPTSGIHYRRDPFVVVIEWNISDANAGNTYIIRLYTNDPPDPRCAM